VQSDVAAYGIRLDPKRGVTDYAQLIQGVGIKNRYVSFKKPVATGTVFVVDKAIRRADWFTEQIDYIGHFERPVLDDRLEVRVQVIRWNDRDPFEPPAQELVRLPAPP